MLQKEDRRLLSLLAVLGLGLSFDSTMRLWVKESNDETLARQELKPALIAPRPQSADLNVLLTLLQPPAPEPEDLADEVRDATPAIIEDEQVGLLAELFIDRHRFRLRGCFARNGETQFAAVERIDADNGARSLDRLQEKDAIGPYKVDSIGHKSLNLTAPDGRTIQLRLFEFDSPINAGQLP